MCSRFYPRLSGSLGSLLTLGKQTVLYGLGSLTVSLVSILLLPVYTRWMDAEEFGILTEMYTYIGFLMVLALLGMDFAYMRFSGLRKVSPDKGYQDLLLVLFALTMPGIVLYLLLEPYLLSLLGYEERKWVVRFTMILLAVDTWTLPGFLRWRLREQVIPYVFWRILGAGLMAGLVIFFVRFPEFPEEFLPVFSEVQALSPPEKVLLANLTGSFAQLLGVTPWHLWIFLFRFPEIPGRLVRLRQYLRYGLPMLASVLLILVNDISDRLWIRFTAPGTPDERLTQVGIYSAVYRIAMVMMLFHRAYRMAADPFFLRRIASVPQEGTRLFVRLGQVYLLFTGWMGFLMLAGGRFLAEAFLGSGEYQEGMEIFPVLVVALWFPSWLYHAGFWVKVSGKSEWMFVSALVSALLTTGINAWGVPRVGYPAAAWATLIAYGSFALMMAWLGARHRPELAFFPLRIWRPLAGVLILLGTGWLISRVSPVESWQEWIGWIVAGTAFAAFWVRWVWKSV